MLATGLFVIISHLNSINISFLTMFFIGLICEVAFRFFERGNNLNKIPLLLCSWLKFVTSFCFSGISGGSVCRQNAALSEKQNVVANCVGGSLGL
ncbi:MAG TPA: hypothetical protein DEH02_15935 [Bacteroidales bacterium]|nr:hypothetical protein [Bacteroidales bacterium]